MSNNPYLTAPEHAQPLITDESEVADNRPLSPDPTFTGVKWSNRKTNDILFAILFGVTMLVMLIISGIAFKHGDPESLLQFEDEDEGNFNSTIQHSIKDKVEDWGQAQVRKLYADRKVLWLALAVILLYGVLWVQFLRMFTREAVYATLAAAVIGLVYLGIHVLSVSEDSKTMRFFGVCLLIAAAVLVFLIFVLRKKINLTCLMMKESCTGLQNNLTVFPVGGVLLAVFILFMIFWLSSFVYLYAVKKGQIKSTDEKGHEEVYDKFDSNIRYLMLFMIFVLYWVTSLLYAVFHYGVSGALASWYFGRTQLHHRTTENATLRSMTHALTTSFGTLAFGSLILAFVQTLNFLLDRTYRQSRKHSRALACVVACVRCCCGCIESLVQMVDRFAYVYAAMYGHNFCTSAKRVFELFGRNAMSMVVLDTLTGMVLGLGRLLGVCIATGVTVGWLHSHDKPINFLTIVVVLFFSYAILKIISLVIGAGVNTVFVCYLEDLERNKGGEPLMNKEIHMVCMEKKQQMDQSEAF